MVRRSGSSFSLPSPAARDKTKLNTIHEHACQVDDAAADDDSAEETRSKGKAPLSNSLSDDKHGTMEVENARLVTPNDVCFERVFEKVFEEVRRLRDTVMVLEKFSCPAVGCGAHFRSVC